MKRYFLLFASMILIVSCQTGYHANDPEIKENIDNYEIKVSQSARIPKDGSGPVAGFSAEAKPDTVITFTSLDDRVFVTNGNAVNFIYDGIDPDDTYIMYESWDDGYYLTLKSKMQGVDVKFHKLCQIFIVGNPSLTRIAVPTTMRYEQIIWTPRNDGTWELRIGSTERGCKSKSLDELQKVRDKGYESKIPK